MNAASAVAPLSPRSPALRTRPPALLVQALWFGLLTWLLEYGARALDLYALHKVVLAAENPHNAWMTAVDDILIFLAAGLILTTVAARRPHWVPARVAVFAFIGLTFFSLGDVVVVRQWYGALLLALGLAAALSRMTARHPESYARLVRYTTPALAAAAFAVTLTVYCWSWLGESRALAALPAAPSQAPNVLLLVMDTVRAQDMSLYGYARETTPRLRRLAARGVCFDRAISTVSWTLPSHASMFTGHYPYEIFRNFDKMINDDWEVPMGTDYPTLAECLARRGYCTGGFVANWMYCDRVYGLNRGFTHYQDYHVSLEQTAKSSFLSRAAAVAAFGVMERRQVLARKDARVVDGEFLHWLDRVPGGPFFAFLNYMDAHEPYLPPAEFTSRFSAPAPEATRPDAPPTWDIPRGIREEQRSYDAGIAYLDREIGRLLDELDRRRLLENTVLIVTSDHGDHFGEHGNISHGDTLYMPVIHVPLIICFPPKTPAGRRVYQTVSLRDLPATVAELLNLGPDAAFPGESLARYWRTTRPLPAARAFSNLDLEIHRGPRTWTVHLKSLVDDRYHYLQEEADGSERLYDLAVDPNETRNLAATAQGHELIAAYRSDPRVLTAGKRTTR